MILKQSGSVIGTQTFVEEHHDLLEGLHEVDVVVAVLLDLQQQAELGQTLGGEGFQKKAVLLRRESCKACRRSSCCTLQSSATFTPSVIITATVNFTRALPRQGGTAKIKQVSYRESSSEIQSLYSSIKHRCTP